MSKSNEITSTTLTMPELRRLLIDGAGRIPKHATITPMLLSGDKRITSDLPPGLRQPPWSELAQQLIQPNADYEIHSFALDSIETHYLFRAIKPGDDRLLLSYLDDANLRLSLVGDQATTLGLLTDQLRPTDAAPPHAIELDLDAPALLALAAVCDELRALFAASLVQREGLTGIALTVEALAGQLELGRKGRDFRWLVAQFARSLGDVAGLETKALAAGLETLQSHGLLSLADGVALPASELINVALDLLNPIPALRVKCTLDRDGEDAANRLHVCRGNRLWVVQWRSGARPATYKFGCYDGLTFLRLLHEFLLEQNIEAPTDESPTASPQKRFCTACGKPLGSDARFCTSCGAALRP